MPFFIKSSFVFMSGFFVRIGFYSMFLVIAISCDPAGAQNLIRQNLLRITADAQLAYANHRFENQDYEEAAAEYKRFIYFFPDDPRTEAVDYKIGMAYFQNKSYIKALGRFTRIFDEKGPKDTGISSAFMISRCYRRIQNYPVAIENLFYLSRITDDTEIQDKIFYQLGWLYLESGEIERSHVAFSRISPKNRTDFQADDLQTNLNAINDLPQKNPLTAGLLSIIPGGGYLYCGRYRDALTAFLVNSVLIYAAYESFDNDLYAIGGMIAVLETGFYAGSIYGGISSAHKFNRARKNEFVRELKTRFVPDFTPDFVPDLSVNFKPGGVFLGMSYHF